MLSIRVTLDFTCYIHPHLALLDIELKRLTVVLNSIHNSSSDIKQVLYYFRYNLATMSPDPAGGSPGTQAERAAAR